MSLLFYFFLIYQSISFVSKSIVYGDASLFILSM